MVRFVHGKLPFLTSVKMHLRISVALVCEICVLNVVAALIFVVNCGSLFKLCVIFRPRYRDFMKDCPTGELKQEVCLKFNTVVVCNSQNMSSKST
jgi:hypothetical protein